MGTNYASDVTIYQLVRDRLPFLVDNEANTARVGRLIYEMMAELEVCFRISDQVTPPDPTRIGNEDYYSVVQKSIIADMVAAYLMAVQAIQAGGGDGTGEVTGTFLKKAKAGSAEVEYDQFDGKKSAMFLNASDTFQIYRKAAMRRAHNIGCIIDICDDCSIVVESLYSGSLKPFVVVGLGNGGCGCC